MKTFQPIAASSMAVLAFAAIAAAQAGPLGGMLGGGPQARGIFNPIPGSGAQYEIQTGSGKDKMTMEVAVVGKESVNGKEGYWLESTMSNTPMGEMVMKMLVVPDGAIGTFGKMVMQMPGHPPMEMPAQMGRIGEQKQPLDIRSKADDLGSESVTTPAGTFTAHHFRMKDGSGDVWLSDQVPPYGLIKGQEKDSTIVLTKVVTDAKDKITGTPVPFNPALLMPGGPGGRPRP